MKKPFTRTEMKILVYNKMKNGMSYDRAKKEVETEVEQCIVNKEMVKKDGKKNTD